MEHNFDLDVAKKYGLNVAIFLQDASSCTEYLLINKNNISQGLCWIRDTVEVLFKIFPYWTRHQLEQTMREAENQSLIVSAYYNPPEDLVELWNVFWCNDPPKEDPKIKFYALLPLSYQLYGALQSEAFFELLYSSISESPLYPTFYPLCDDPDEISYDRFRSAFVDSNTDTKSNINKDIIYKKMTDLPLCHDSSLPANGDLQ